VRSLRLRPGLTYSPHGIETRQPSAILKPMPVRPFTVSGPDFHGKWRSLPAPHGRCSRGNRVVGARHFPAAGMLQPQTGFAALACLLLLSGPAAFGGNPLRAADVSQRAGQESAQQLVRDVVWNEVQSQVNDRTYWRYREAQEGTGIGKLLDVFETQYGTIHRLLAVDGRQLSAKDLDAEDHRIEKLLNRPTRLAEEQRKRHEDAEQQRQLLEMLPNAFLFREEGRQGSVVRIAFTPNPSFRPATHVAEVFHHMEGTMLVDGNAKRLIEIDGRLTSKVKFAGGLLGHLDEGGTFRVQQRDVGAGHWDMVLLDVHMDGKALFFKTISVREKETYSDFHEVPANLTLRQAAQALKEDATAWARLSGN
jgi:hypothetical protein